MSRKNIEIRLEPFRNATEVKVDGKKCYVRTNRPLDDPQVRSMVDAYVNSESSGKINGYRLRVRSW